MTRRVPLAAAALLAAAAAAWLLSRPAPPTDEELVRALFDEAAAAAEARQVGDAVAGLSERFAGGGLDKQGVKRLVAANALRGAWVAVRVAGARVTVEGDEAGAEVDLVLARAGAGRPLAEWLPSEASAWRIEARLEREPEGWRVVSGEWRAIPFAEALSGGP